MRLIGTVRSASIGIAMACVAAIFLVTIFEIVVRLMGSPTTWAADTTTYLLCFAVGAAFPVITLEAGHVAINFLDGLLPTRWASSLSRALSLASGVACAAAAAALIDTVTKQYASGITTVTTFTFPKWILNSALCYGFATSAAVFILDALYARRLIVRT